MLEGIRIVDLTVHLSGPYCTWLLGHLGADVVKVERPGGDPARQTGPFLDGESLYFASLNRNKRSIVLDLKSRADRDVLHALLGTADVLVENFRPGVMDRLGLDAATLERRYPGLIYASISGFGQDGPLARRPAFDIIAQAMSGLMSVTGPEGGPAVRVGASIGDIAAALFATIEIVAALLARERSGKAPRVDIAMLDCQIALLENAVSRNLNLGEVPCPVGSRHPLITPFQAFPASDGRFVVAVDGEAAWQRFARAIGRGDLLEDERFLTAELRNANQARLERCLTEVFSLRPRAEWLAILEAADIPCGPVNDVGEAMKSPQVAARRMISEVERTGESRKRFAAAPLATRGAMAERPAPKLGEHTEEILAQLGLYGTSRPITDVSET